MKNVKFCMLMILDGWGINPEEYGNAFAQANTPCLDSLMEEYPVTSLKCSGEDVGLPDGIMGNSEVGHLNIGAGRIVYQDLLRIDKSISDGSFFENQSFESVMSKIKENDSSLHLMGLVSDGGVHSQLTHLFALIDMAKKYGLEKVFIHVILDGRDTPPDSGAGYVASLKEYIDKKGCGKIGSVCGRYYAMDRDTRWDRTKKAYDLYVEGRGEKLKDPVDAIHTSYGNKIFDEFVTPVAIVGEDNEPIAKIKNDDGVIFFNFRADRARQITRAMTERHFDFFERESIPSLCEYVCMTSYEDAFSLPVAFGQEKLHGILGEIINNEGLRQLRIAETEKYAHVTYFFNGGEEVPFSLEDRCLIPSPRDVATYDLKPEMSAVQVKEEVISRIKEGTYKFIVLNFANMDMVGHTGVFEAAVKACEVVDACVNDIVAEIKKAGGVVFVTADHGNSEKMINDEGEPFTSHTLNQVSFILVDDQRKNAVLRQGKLGDIAPTILDVMGIEKSKEMTGESMIEK